MFKILSPNQTGVDFANNVIESEELNILNFHYIYNGGGVGIGDFNNDGLPDLVFSGNQVPSKIYLNQGDLSFKDITQSANFITQGWATGISIVDINADGWDDIYISVGGYECEGNCKNYFFIHQGLNENGMPFFENKAADYGLEDGLYTQQALFFDYDLDDDLDVYLLHNVIDKRDKNAPTSKERINEKSKDQLFENRGEGTFVEVSDSLGINHRGYGLGITICDFNQDFYPDIYVANDFLSDDLLYLNKGKNGSKHKGFEEVSKQKLKHTSYNAMGVDVADVNNDQLPDIFVLDMLPAYNERQKTMLGFMNYNKFLLTLQQKYTPQFIRNTLQIHNGVQQNELLPFSEVGYLAGVYNTDWSWTPLLADFDNDGDRDLFVTNGYGKDITDLDFINYSHQRSPFGGKENQQQKLYEVVAKMNPITMPNYIFENKGDLNFQEKNTAWLKKENSISNGAAYADLDNDGDLDLIVNNLNQPAFIMENTVSNKNNFIKIKLKGPKNNPTGIGVKIEVQTKDEKQTAYQSPVRGYLSTVENILHFGIGKNETIDFVKVYWSETKVELLSNVKANQLITIDFKNSVVKNIEKTNNASVFTKKQYLKFDHKENSYIDFNIQPLLMNQYSKEGPCLASANIDEMQGDELFIGGAKGFPAQLFYQNDEGGFIGKELPNPESENTDALFFDFDQDGDLDLYIVNGGSEFSGNANQLTDELYLNDGKGNFTKDANQQLPNGNGSCVRACDYDQDGDLDLFIGGRMTPNKYPDIPRSYLLLNKDGKLLDYTHKMGGDFLAKAGMITDALWTDYDQDGWQDLMLVGEWMPITVFLNKDGYFNEKNKIEIPNSSGFWNCITSSDIDNDGDEDYVLGNLGTNSRMKASAKEPLYLYKEDYDKNGSNDPLIGQFYENKKGERKLYPLHTRDDIIKQLPMIKNRYVQYAAFGEVTLSELLEADLNSDAFLKIDQTQSCMLINEGGGKSSLKILPTAAQTAPIQSILIKDINQDGHPDLIMVGNDFTSEKNNGWYDAFNGLILLGDGKGTFKELPAAQSNFIVSKDARDIIQLKTKEEKNLIIVGQNSAELNVFEMQK